jgi:flagellar hook-length control protein FliK
LALKVAAESGLSTNRLPDGPVREQGLFPTDRPLQGTENSGKDVPSAASQLSPSQQKIEPILKGSLKENDAGQNSGKESSDPAASSAAGRPDQMFQRGSSVFSDLLSREVPLQGKGAAALEDGLQHVVRFLQAEGRHTANIVVDPPALGRMEIELVTTAKGIEAAIKVGSEQIRQLVQDHIVVLRNHLEQQGVHLGEFVVDLRDNSKGHSGRNAFSGESRRRAASGGGRVEQNEETVPSFRMDLEHGLLTWVA